MEAQVKTFDRSGNLKLSRAEQYTRVDVMF